MIAPLPHLRVRSIEKLIGTAHEPLLVLTEGYEAYYLKYHKGTKPYELQAEWLCHYLLRLWGISTPQVAVLHTPEELWQRPPKFAARAASYLHGACFGSLEVPYAHDSMERLRETTDPAMLVNASDLVWLSFFDAWIGNDDRWASHHNLLLAPAQAGSRQLRCWAIDHAYVFGRLDPQHLRPNYGYFELSKNLIGATTTKAVIEQQRAAHPLFLADELRQGYYFRIRKCQDHFSEVCDQLPDEYRLSAIQQTNLAATLFDSSRLNVILKAFLSYLNL